MPAKAEIERQHAQTVKRLLAAEAAAHALLNPPVAMASARVRDQVSRTGSGSPRRSVLAAIQAHSDRLRIDARNAVLMARHRARELGREQLQSDLRPVHRWALRNSQASPPSPTYIEHAASLDAFEADRVASAIHTAWGSSLLSGLIGWEKRGEKGQLTSALDVTRVLAPKLERHAATQAASAYADERQSYWDNLAEMLAPAGNDEEPPPESGERESPGPALFHVWSAVLDRRTCEDCSALDGSTVPIDEDFEAGATTPLHPDCRCVILTTFDEDELGGTVDRQAVGDQVKSATIPSLMKLF